MSYKCSGNVFAFFVTWRKRANVRPWLHNKVMETNGDEIRYDGDSQPTPNPSGNAEDTSLIQHDHDFIVFSDSESSQQSNDDGTDLIPPPSYFIGSGQRKSQSQIQAGTEGPKNLFSDFYDFRLSKLLGEICP